MHVASCACKCGAYNYAFCLSRHIRSQTQAGASCCNAALQGKGLLCAKSAIAYLHAMQVCQLHVSILVQVQHLKEGGDDVDSAHEGVSQLVLYPFAVALPSL